jgi:hypothetical protein
LDGHALSSVERLPVLADCRLAADYPQLLAGGFLPALSSAHDSPYVDGPWRPPCSWALSS